MRHHAQGGHGSTWCRSGAWGVLACRLRRPLVFQNYSYHDCGTNYLMSSQDSGGWGGRVWLGCGQNGGSVWVARPRRTSSEGGWVWCRHPPTMPPPRAALSGPSPLSTSRAGVRNVCIVRAGTPAGTSKHDEFRKQLVLAGVPARTLLRSYCSSSCS